MEKNNVKMGNQGSRLLSYSGNAMSSMVSRGRKRKCIEESDMEYDSSFIEKTMQTPKRLKKIFYFLNEM